MMTPMKNGKNLSSNSIFDLVTLSPLTVVSPNQRFTSSQLRPRYSIRFELRF